MDEAVAGAIIGVAAGVMAGGIVFLVVLLQKAKKCPDCGTAAPKFRIPANRRQMLWGGWTCPECGCELDRRWRMVESNES
jgi:hypothetical protein